MHKFLFLVCFGFFLAIFSCDKNDISEKLQTTDSLILSHNYTQANLILVSIDTTNLSKNSNIYYHLLRNEIDCLQTSILPDSTIFDKYINFFTLNYDYYKLAKAYHDKASLIYNSGNIRHATNWNIYAYYYIQKCDTGNFCASTTKRKILEQLEKLGIYANKNKASFYETIEWKNYANRILHFATIIVFCLIAYFIHTHKQTKRLKRIIKLYTSKRKIENAIHYKNSEIAKRQHQRHIKKLIDKISDVQNDTNNNIKHGKILYEGLVIKGKNISLWKQSDFSQCLAYCEIEYEELTHAINKEYKGIQKRAQLMLILRAQGYDNDTIARIYGIMPDSVRKAFARLKPCK